MKKKPYSAPNHEQKLDESAGIDDARQAVPLIALRANRNIRDVLEKITKAEPARKRAALDELVRLIQRDPMRWAEVYEAADYLRGQSSYWKSKGFATFEECWQSLAGSTFATLKDLEQAYNYALLACPDLFDVDWSEAHQKAGQIARIRQVRAAGRANGGRPTVSRTGQYDSESEAQKRVQQGGAYVDKGSNSFERRVAKLKRDAPLVYADMEAGRYFRTTKSGTITIDLPAAERDAYGKARGKKKAQKPSSKTDRPNREAAKAIAALRAAAQSSTSRELLAKELRSMNWVVKAVCGGKH